MREGSDPKILPIADKSGFSSEQSFYRNFKKYTGMNPAHWMTKNRPKP
ncbi:MAG: hypothetical protein Q4F34_04870 [Prevotellaceae bacterium]|nr:hypothetical protein [Prevotellaceae bacterium]